jgi:GR25 family glycosyltransferase involved in LPS biosynthesis
VYGYLIVEDDAELTPNFYEKLMKCLKDAPNADIIFLSHHAYPQYNKQEYYDKNVMPTVELWTKERCERESMGGTTAYFISKRGCQNMLNVLHRKGFTYAIDWELFKSADINKIYYSTPFLAFAECVQKANVDSDIQRDFNKLSFEKLVEIETEYWVKKDKQVIFREKLKESGILKTISVFKYTKDIINQLKLYPLWWYEVSDHIFVVPEPFLTTDIRKDKTFFESYLNEFALVI